MKVESCLTKDEPHVHLDGICEYDLSAGEYDDYRDDFEEKPISNLTEWDGISE